MTTLTRFLLDDVVTRTINTNPHLKDSPLTSDELLAIYQEADNRIAKIKTYNPLRKLWFKLLRKTLKQMAEEIYQIPDN